MAPTVISFSDRNATPPVFVAGGFTDWNAVELVATEQAEGQYLYEKTFDLTPGNYQFKFRLGPGDWWVCDEQIPRTTDAAGNENNHIVVEDEPPQKASDNVPTPTAVTKDFKDDAPVVNGTSEPDIADTTATPENSTPAAESLKTPEDKPTARVDNIASSQNVVQDKIPEAPKETPANPAPPVETFEPAITQSTEPKRSPPPAVEERVVVNGGSSEAQQAIMQSAETKVNGSASPKPGIKKADSKASSVSSVPPVDKTSKTKDGKPKGPNWFARIFLCGSSRNVMLAAVAVGLPILVAYFIKK